MIGAVVVDGDGLVVDLGWCRRPSRARREREMSGGTAAGGEEAEGDEGALRGRVLSGGGTVQASQGWWRA